MAFAHTLRPPPRSPLFPYTTLFRSWDRLYASTLGLVDNVGILTTRDGKLNPLPFGTPLINDTTLNAFEFYGRSEEHTSELQSRGHLVCRLLLEKKNETATSQR